MRFSPAYEERQSILKNMRKLSRVLETENESGYTDEEDLSSRSNPQVSESVVPEITSPSISGVFNEKGSASRVYASSSEQAYFRPQNFQRRFSYMRWLSSSTQSDSMSKRKLPAQQKLNLNKRKTTAAKRKLEENRNERSTSGTKPLEAKIKENLKKKKLEERMSQVSEVGRSKGKVRKKPWERY